MAAVQCLGTESCPELKQTKNIFADLERNDSVALRLLLLEM